MKKIILIVMVCFLIPCFGFAQEPNGLFGLTGTLWEPQIEDGGPYTPDGVGFYAGKVYMVDDEWDPDCGMYPSSSYTDYLFISCFEITAGDFIVNGILSSLLRIGCVTDPYSGEKIRLKKVSNDWMPSEECIVLDE